MSYSADTEVALDFARELYSEARDEFLTNYESYYTKMFITMIIVAACSELEGTTVSLNYD